MYILEAIIYLLLGITFIAYSILITRKKFRKLIIRKNRYIKNISIFFGILTGLNLIMIGVTLFNKQTFMPSLCFKTNAFISLFIYVILYLLNVVGRKLDKNEKVFQKRNIIIFALFIIMIFHIVLSLSLPTFIYDKENETIKISDVMYRREIKLDDINGVAIKDNVPDVIMPLFKVFNFFTMKGKFKSTNNENIVIINNLQSEKVLEIEDNKYDYIEIGFLDADECQKIYDLLSSYLNTKFYKEEEKEKEKEKENEEEEIIHDYKIVGIESTKIE